MQYEKTSIWGDPGFFPLISDLHETNTLTIFTVWVWKSKTPCPLQEVNIFNRLNRPNGIYIVYSWNRLLSIHKRNGNMYENMYIHPHYTGSTIMIIAIDVGYCNFYYCFYFFFCFAYVISYFSTCTKSIAIAAGHNWNLCLVNKRIVDTLKFPNCRNTQSDINENYFNRSSGLTIISKKIRYSFNNFGNIHILAHVRRRSIFSLLLFIVCTGFDEPEHRLCFFESNNLL